MAAYLAVLVTLAVVDGLWIWLVAIGQFQATIGPLMKASPDLAAVGAFYLIYTLGVVVLAVRPAVSERSMGRAALLGAMLGLSAYATFDLTNLAILKGWTWKLALIDIVWGSILTSIAAGAGYAAASRRSGGAESRSIGKPW
jgi:uncharacterized membrane protein